MMHLYFQKENNSVQELLEKTKKEETLEKDCEKCFEKLRKDNIENSTSLESEKEKLVMEPCNASEDGKRIEENDKEEIYKKKKIEEILNKK